MEIKIQFETKNDLSGYEGIARIKDLSYGVSSPDSFKYECNPDWAQGRDILVDQVMIFWKGIFISGKPAGDTLGHFVEKWKDIF